MRYFRAADGTVYGYDDDQGDLAEAALSGGAEEITGAWPPPSPAVDLRAYVAAKRWAVQTGGVVVDGISIDTSDASRSMIADMAAYLQASGVETVEFKATSGWATLTAAEVVAIGLAVGAHVQACFVAERAITASIDAGAITSTAEIDAWPWP